MIELLRQRSRPYLFSNTVSPSVVAGAIKALEILSRSTELRDQLQSNTEFFRQGMLERGFDIIPGTHPIAPIMFYDAPKAVELKAVYVIAF
ncbi:MAG: aminotransferase class I/II-fold pyridoxal phosphate-dependent enzyme, partial [Gammaproteobacteria bacterium]|nr:aminotransferase class I/II-fold pyridoxal phosphate-dependent enzyme [Gammaproteobacteria bacterium]